MKLAIGERLLRSQQTMIYREFKPGARLQSWVAAYWHFSVSPNAGAPLFHTIPLTGAAMLAVSMSGRWIAVEGPRIDERHAR